MRKKVPQWLADCVLGITIGLLSILGGKSLSLAEEVAAQPIGAEACLACHADRADFKDNVHAKAWAAKGTADFNGSCEKCHGAGSLHADAAGDRNNPGFATIKNPKEMAASESSAVCLACHEKGGQTHFAGSTHDSHGVSCASCHSLHGGHGKNLAKAVEMDVCFQCHKDVKTQISRASHHPIKEGKVTCTDCHQPHGTAEGSLLAEGSVNQTCFKCHAEKRGPMLWEHRPVSEDCTICHTPHGSNHGKLLAKKNPFLCQSCHSNSRHPGTIYALNPTASGSNTYQKSNARAFYRGCLNCHQNIHGSNHPSGKTFLR